MTANRRAIAAAGMALAAASLVSAIQDGSYHAAVPSPTVQAQLR